MILAFYLPLSTPSSFGVRTVTQLEQTEHQAEGTKKRVKATAASDSNERSIIKGGGTASEHHLLELHREGEKLPPARGGEGVDGPIGTLSCSTLVHAEKNWKTEVSRFQSIQHVWGGGIGRSVRDPSLPCRTDFRVFCTGRVLLQ